MQLIKCDSKGRVYLREEWREIYGERFIAIKAPRELIFLPVPENPIADLQELGKRLKGETIADIKRKIRERAKQDVVK